MILLTDTFDLNFSFLCATRMGSFNSAPKILNADTQDNELTCPPHGLNHHGLVQHCRLMRGEHLPPLLSRAFLRPFAGLRSPPAHDDVTDGLRVLQLNTVSKACSGPMAGAPPAEHIRLFQWNILSQCERVDDAAMQLILIVNQHKL